jgi:demethylmenaquinone methyltransferase/2-methoxy-6-polyprenyl-1,4-benzoquinol methylase
MEEDAEEPETVHLTSALARKYERTAPLYDILDWPWERQYREWRPSIVGDLSGRVLEVGVGTGQNLRHYPPGGEIHAVDLSEAMLARARRRVGLAKSPVELAQADALELRHVPDATFDWYIATFLYCVLPDALQPGALSEMARVLKPGGRFRLLEILYSRRWARRLAQKALAPLVHALYGARFDRRTLEHLGWIPDVEVTGTRWLRGDSYLLIDGRRR